MKKSLTGRRSNPTGRQITLLAHPPERRRRSVVIAPCGCCTCCCCCCLHTVGSVIGAGVASASATGRVGARLYWRTVAVLLLGLGVIVGLNLNGRDMIGNILIGGVIGLLVFPGVQLAASLLAVLIAAFGPASHFPDRGAAMWAIGKITIWTVVGGLIGIGVMVGIAVAMGAFK